MRNGFVLFVAAAFSTSVGYSQAGDKEHDAAVAHLKKVRVEVVYRSPLKQVWLKPRKGEELDREPLRVWFHDNWILREGVWVNVGWQPKEVDLGYLPKLQDLYGVTFQFEAAFQSERICKDWLRVLKKTPKLKELILHGANFSDEFTPHLRDLKELDSLSLTCTRITDKGLENLKGLKSLEFISLVGTKGITDAGFRQLPLKNLRFLNLDDTKVTDKGIAALKDAHDLEWL